MTSGTRHKKFILTKRHEIRNPSGQIFQHYEESILLGLYIWCDRLRRARRHYPDVIEHVTRREQFRVELLGKRDSGPERATGRFLHHLRFRQFPRGIERPTSWLDVFFVACRHDSIFGQTNGQPIYLKSYVDLYCRNANHWISSAGDFLDCGENQSAAHFGFRGRRDTQ